MTLLRPLGETIADLADSAVGTARADDAPADIRVASVEFSLPIDIALTDDTGFHGDVPLFRRRTAFDPEPAHLRIVLSEVPA